MSAREETASTPPGDPVGDPPGAPVGDPPGAPSGSAGDRRPRTRAQWTLAGLIVALAGGAALYRLLVYGQLQQTAALFIGLPAALAVMLALSAPAQSATGMAMKGMTIALLLSGPLLGEGFICILMASPLFYAVALVVGLAIDGIRERQHRPGREAGTTLHGLALLPVVALSLEGVAPGLSFPRAETVATVRTVSATAEEVEAALAGAPRFQGELPAFLRIGFPVPVAADGAGLEPGDRRTIQFQARRQRPLVLEVAERGPGFVRFRAVSDATPIARWLRWQEAEARWSEVAPGRTQVRWTLRYERRLDPAWYFGPWERYATRLAADYLIQSAATPPHAR